MPNHRRRLFRYFLHIFSRSWLGRQDSNLGMAVPKTAALPLGDAPTAAVFNQGGVGLQGVFGADLRKL
jgi:hypothetical protein